MTEIVLGTAGRDSITVDLELLLRTRLLIQASSGGGKSWLIRRLAEQSCAHVPVIIVDPEGEFASLREKFDFLLVGRGGDTPADVRLAPLLARRILEHGLSAVCDIFEMIPEERHRWVQAFLTAMVDAPKHLWRPALVIIDEAHKFAPEGGKGRSVASEAVAALATTGRKRGFAAVLATQRLGKLAKDTAAELQNVLIGKTTLDLDRERAADALSVRKAALHEFDARVRRLEPGSFFALGRAFPAAEAEPLIVKVGEVETTHPEPGAAGSKPPPPTGRIAHLLPQLADLPKEAEEEARTVEELRAEVLRLRRKTADTDDLAFVRSQLVQAQTAAENAERALREQRAAYGNATAAEVRRLRAMDDAVDRLIKDVAAAGKNVDRAVDGPPRRSPPPPETVSPPVAPPDRPYFKERRERAKMEERARGTDPDATVGPGPMAMLTALAAVHPEPLTRRQLATICGIKVKTSTLRNNLSTLRVAGLLGTPEGTNLVVLTPEGRAKVQGHPVPATPRALLEMWCGHLNSRTERDVLTFLATEHGPVTRERLHDHFGIPKSTSTMRNVLSSLRTNGLITDNKRGVSIAPELAL